MEISPVEAKKDYLFVHVLSATDSGIEQVPSAKVNFAKNKIQVSVSDHSFDFDVP